MSSEEETKPQETVPIEKTSDQPPQAPKVVMRQQEEKLRAKYPGLKGPGSSSFLQKRLSKGQKYFDSGDYNMAKAKGPQKMGPPLNLPPGKGPVAPVANVCPMTGEVIATPESVPHRKTSLVQSKLAGVSTS